MAEGSPLLYSQMPITGNESEALSFLSEIKALSLSPKTAQQVQKR
jgi:hypothetical protein